MMAYERMDSATARAADRAQKVMDRAQEAAGRAGVYVQKQFGEVSERTRDLAHTVGESMQEYGGRSADVWSEVREYVRAHPLQLLAALVAVGYVLGKVILRPSTEA